jgi:putative sigma-54 modulation protein
MKVSISFRHFESTEAIKAHTRQKLGKLERFLPPPITAKVTLSVEQHRHAAEVQISGGGEHLEAKEVSTDMYASIDRVIAKLGRQIVATKGAAEARRREQAALSLAAATAAIKKKAPAGKKAKKKAAKK